MIKNTNFNAEMAEMITKYFVDIQRYYCC